MTCCHLRSARQFLTLLVCTFALSQSATCLDVVTSATAAGSNDSSVAALCGPCSAIKNCVNNNYTLQSGNFTKALADNLEPHLYLEDVWWSQKQTGINLTVVTQLSIDRLPALWDQCLSWPGPISAAVHVVLFQNRTDRLTRKNSRLTSTVRQKLVSFHKKTETRAECALDLMFFWEVFEQREGALLYPVNSLRNHARLQVRTPLMAAIDVDMMISQALSRELLDPQRSAWLISRCLNKEVFVLPAFEPPDSGTYFPGGLVRTALKGGKDSMKTLYENSVMLQFKVKAFPSGHTPTNYSRWFSAIEPYEIDWTERYEPWFISHRDIIPYYDSSFKGYGMNKIVHVMNIHYIGFKFMVHPTGFIIHRPHKQSESRKVVAKQAFLHNQKREDITGTLYEKVRILYNQSLADMKAGAYQPAVDRKMLECSKQFPWTSTSQPVARLLAALS